LLTLNCATLYLQSGRFTHHGGIANGNGEKESCEEEGWQEESREEEKVDQSVQSA
jgi:hypothetical protein